MEKFKMKNDSAITKEDPEGSSSIIDAEEEDNEVDPDAPLSIRKSKMLNRLTVAELKQLVANPEVVESHDVTAPEPEFLVLLKSLRNTVPVPPHWSQKRKYLQGKRGIEKVRSGAKQQPATYHPST